MEEMFLGIFVIMSMLDVFFILFNISRPLELKPRIRAYGAGVFARDSRSYFSNHKKYCAKILFIRV